MKQRKKSLGIWIFLLLLFWGQWVVPAKASGPELRDVDMQMLGGQIRTITPMGLRMIGCIKKSYLQELESSGAVVEYGMVLLPKTYLGEQELETITPMGLRMIGCIKKSYLQELESSGAVVEYGMVLLPKTYLGEQELELDRKYLYNGAVYKPAKVTAVKKFSKKFSEDDDRIYFTAVLANLSKERYKNDYAARVYAKITRTISNEEGSWEKLQERFPMKKDLGRKRQRLYTVTIQSTAKSIRLHRRQWTERQRQRKIRSGCGKTF